MPQTAVSDQRRRKGGSDAPKLPQETTHIPALLVQAILASREAGEWSEVRPKWKAAIEAAGHVLIRVLHCGSSHQHTECVLCALAARQHHLLGLAGPLARSLLS